ncbi:hypothetical protein BV25DRAFT_1857161 [Artomyces pyxidatus]|uniref:Uncharacterized protein n=1 Tax=Artomyces pyxidatus TaxID=48021 RepID=A0ACB8SYP8_9AGAM|nr:hypothetical protein BV25DRAFT_1857161 [Artomyces pyxidatus]
MDSPFSSTINFSSGQDMSHTRLEIPSTRQLFTRNPKGRNQYKDCPDKDDERVADLLRGYHRQGITDRKLVSRLLHDDHGITMSVSTVARRRKALGLRGSGAMTRATPDAVKKQLVLNQLAKNPMQKNGPRAIKEAIAAETGVHLTRDYIAREMRAYDPVGFTVRDPSTTRPDRLSSISFNENTGIHREWVYTSSERLARIGFPVCGLRDEGSGKWLALYVVPAQTTWAFKAAVGYSLLQTIEMIGGIPPLISPDGQELPRCECIDILRPFMSKATTSEEWDFFESIRQYRPERSLLLESWANSIASVWEAGVHIYNASDPRHYELSQWLWPKMIQTEANRFMSQANDHIPGSRSSLYQVQSGQSPNALYDDPSIPNFLQPVDRNLVRSLASRVDGDALMRFVRAPYVARAENELLLLGVAEVSLQNVWSVFVTLLPVMYPSLSVMC